MKTEILCSLTTLGYLGNTWRDKIAELTSLRIPRIALFLTGVRGEERSALIHALITIKKSHYQLEIPFVHATSAMKDSEYKFLVDQFGTKAFNLHPTRFFKLEHTLSNETLEKIFIENATDDGEMDADDLKGFAGLCIDISHLEDLKRFHMEGYLRLAQLIDSNKVGVNHISAVRETSTRIDNGRPGWSDHTFNKLDEFDYIIQHKTNTFGEFAAIELEDSFSVQLKVKQHIENLLEKFKLEQSTIERKAA